MPVAVGAVGGAAGGAVASADVDNREDHSPATYGATVLSNVVYFPAKVIFTIGGALGSGVGYLVSGADESVSNSIWEASVEGDYLVTPGMIEGREPVRFVGP